MQARFAIVIVAVVAAFVWWPHEEQKSRAPRGEALRAEWAATEPVATQEDRTTAPKPATATASDHSHGPCSVRVSLSDEATGAPVASRIQLYRVDVPLDGALVDVYVRAVQIQRGGTEIDDLRVGRYRFRAEAQRRDTDDGPAFDVGGAGMILQRALPMPRAIRFVLAIDDEHDVALQQGALQWSGWAKRDAPEPKWLRHPPATHPWEHMRVVSPRGGRSGTRMTKPVTVVAVNDRFDLGTRFEHTWGELRSSRWRWSSPGRTSVVSGGGMHNVHDSRTRLLVGVSYPAEPTLAGILLPDGRRADRAGARIDVWTVASDTSAIFFNELPYNAIFVAATLDGYRKLEFRVDPLETQFHPRTMQPEKE